MKPAISYGVRHAIFNGFDVVEITSKTKFYFAGRELNGRNTRGKLFQLKAEYTTKEQAEAAAKRATEVRDSFQAELRENRRQMNDILDRRDAAIKEALK